MSDWISVNDDLPAFNVMVWVATPLWCISRDGIKEFSPVYDMACLKDGTEKLWMTANFTAYTFDEITNWMPISPLPDPPA
jgi:hypothetical protein